MSPATAGPPGVYSDAEYLGLDLRHRQRGLDPGYRRVDLPARDHQLQRRPGRLVPQGHLQLRHVLRRGQPVQRPRADVAVVRGRRPEQRGSATSTRSTPAWSSSDPAGDVQQVLLAVQRVVVGPRPGRRRPADRLVVVERALQHALAAGQRRAAAAAARAPGRPGSRPPAWPPRRARPVRSGTPRSRASTGSTGPGGVGRDLQAEPVHRLVHPGAGPAQRRHQHQRRELAEVAGRCWTCSCRSAGARGSAAASSRSGSCVTAQSVTCQPCRPWRSVCAHGVLDRPEERERHRAELDLEPERSRPRRPAPARPAGRRWPGTGCRRCRRSRTAAPVPAGRSMQIVVVSRKATVEAELARPAWPG